MKEPRIDPVSRFSSENLKIVKQYIFGNKLPRKKKKKYLGTRSRRRRDIKRRTDTFSASRLVAQSFANSLKPYRDFINGVHGITYIDWKEGYWEAKIPTPNKIESNAKPTSFD